MTEHQVTICLLTFLVGVEFGRFARVLRSARQERKRRKDVDEVLARYTPKN